VTGNDPNVLAIRVLKVDQGRFYNMEDQLQRAHVAVIGSEAKENCFRDAMHWAEHIRLDGLSLKSLEF